jgi:hypothetical protein
VSSANRSSASWRLVYRLARRRFGEVSEPVAVARHHRGPFWAGPVSELAYERAARTLPARLRDPAVYRVATLFTAEER